MNDLSVVKIHLEHRVQIEQLRFQEHVQNKRWSQVAGWDGIITGLKIALIIVDEEIKLRK